MMATNKETNNKALSDVQLEQVAGGYTDSEGMVVTLFYRCSSYKEALLPGVAGSCGTCSHMYVKNLIMYCGRSTKTKL